MWINSRFLEKEEGTEKGCTSLFGFHGDLDWFLNYFCPSARNKAGERQAAVFSHCQLIILLFHI